MNIDFLNRPMSRRATWLAFVLLAAALFAAYGNSFHGPFIFDDSSSIEDNPTIKAWSTALFPPGNSGLTVSGRPLVNLSLAINYKLGGKEVTGYHVMNLCIHILATLALFGWVRRTLLLPTMRGKFGDASWWTALVVALLWGLHPLQTESVTYVIQRAESLVGMFFLATLYFFIRAAAKPESKLWSIAAVAACCGGMASKEVMAFAPVVVLLFDRAFVSGSFYEAWRQRKGLYCGLAASWILLAVCVLSTGSRGATVGYNEYASWWRYALTQCYAIVHYLWLAIWPNTLVLDYGQTLAHGFADASKQFALVIFLLMGTVWLSWKRPVLGFIGIFFFAVLAPSSSVVPVLTQTLAEHRMYLALVSLLAMAVIITQYFIGPRVLIFWFIVVIAFGYKTHLRNYDYRDEETIWRSVTEKCPYNPRGWCCLAMVYTRDENFAKAKQTLKLALLYSPDNTNALSDYGNVLYKLKETQEAEEVFRYTLKLAPEHYGANCGLGALLLDQGKPEEALDYFQRALRTRSDGMEARYNRGKALVALKRLPEAVTVFSAIIASDAKAAGARNNLGDALIGLGKADQAIPILKAGLVFLPKDPELRCTLGLAYLSLGQADQALQWFKNVIADFPNNAKAHADLALVLAGQGKTSEACEHYETALRFKGDMSVEIVRDIQVSVGGEWLKNGRADLARLHYEKAVELDPNNSQLQYLLANLLLRTGDVAASIPIYERIVTIQPNNADAHNELGVAYLQTGKNGRARQQFQAALAIQSDHAGAKENLRKLDSFGH